jgi:hypothetical protein
LLQGLHHLDGFGKLIMMLDWAYLVIGHLFILYLGLNPLKQLLFQDSRGG